MEKKSRRFIKKVLAVTLSAAMAFSAAAVTKPTTACAAVKLSKTAKTLTVGKSFKLKLKKNKKNWYIKKAVSNKPKVAKVKKQTSKAVTVKGKKPGKAKIRVVLRKKGKDVRKVLTCQVKVVSKKEPAPAVPSEPAVPSVPSQPSEPTEPGASQPEEMTVSTQAELDAALANSSLTKLTIDTAAAEQFVIPKGAYPEVDLIVKAPASDVENNGVFHSIQLMSIKPDTWVENAIGNALNVLAEVSRIVVNEGAQVKDITYAKMDASALLEIHGSVTDIHIKTKTVISISGEPENKPKVTVEENASDTEITSEAPIDMMIFTSTKITLNEGAEDSSVEIGKNDVSVTVTNMTTTIVPVKKPDGTTVGVRAKRTTKVVSNQPAITSPSGSGGSSSGSGGSGNTAYTPSGGAIDGGGITGGASGVGSVIDGSGNPVVDDVPFPTVSNMADGITATVAVVISGPSIVSCSAICTLTVELDKNMTIASPLVGGKVQIPANWDGVQAVTWQDLDTVDENNLTKTWEPTKENLSLQESEEGTVDAGYVVAFRYRDADGNVGQSNALTVVDYAEAVLRQYLTAYKDKYYNGGPVNLAWEQPVDYLDWSDLDNPLLTYQYDETIVESFNQQ